MVVTIEMMATSRPVPRPRQDADFCGETPWPASQPRHGQHLHRGQQPGRLRRPVHRPHRARAHQGCLASLAAAARGGATGIAISHVAAGNGVNADNIRAILRRQRARVRRRAEHRVRGSGRPDARPIGAAGCAPRSRRPASPSAFRASPASPPAYDRSAPAGGSPAGAGPSIPSGMAKCYGSGVATISSAKPDELAAAAFALFSTRGIAGVNMDEIAAGAGVTKGSLYWHYASKKRSSSRRATSTTALAHRDRGRDRRARTARRPARGRGRLLGAKLPARRREPGVPHRDRGDVAVRRRRARELDRLPRRDRAVLPRPHPPGGRRRRSSGATTSIAPSTC